MVVRQYARWMGLLIVLVGVVGLLLGEGHIFGTFNIDVVEDIIHLLTGGLMAYAGFRGGVSLVQSVVGGLGIVYLLVGVLGFVIPNLLGLLPNGYNLWDNGLHLLLGALGIALRWFVGREQRAGTAMA